MKKNKKRTLKFYSTIDVLAIEEYLEAMAEKGFLFTGCSGIFYNFEKGEPAKRKYHVELFHDGSAFGSSGDNEETKAYAAQWEEKGWEYIYANGRQVFFMSEDLDTEPMTMEPEVQLKRMRKCINGEFIAWPIWLMLCIGNFFTFNNSWPTEFIETSNLSLCWVAILIFVSTSVLRSLFCYLNNKKRVTKDQSIEFPEAKQARWFSALTTGMLAAALVFLMISLAFESKEAFGVVLLNLAIITAIIFFGFKLMRSIGGKKTKVQQVIIVIVLAVVASIVSVIVAVSVAVFDDGDRTIEYYDEYGNTITESVDDDEIPLTQKDLGTDVSNLIKADTYCNRYVTIYGNVLDCWQMYYDKHGGVATNLSYNIAECRFDWVKDKLINNYMTSEDYGDGAKFTEASSSEADAWEAEKVYTVTGKYNEGIRLVIYEDTVLFIDNEIKYTNEVIKSIKDKLGDWLK